MIRRAWINGTTISEGHAAVVAVTDRGLAYGDGLFETVRIVAGRAVLLDAHLARLKASAEVLGIPLDAGMAAAFAGFLAGSGDAVAKIILTRGNSGRGYLPDPESSSTLIFTLHPPVSWPDGLAAAPAQIDFSFDKQAF